jgi:YXWGXW repeat-containing protein
VSTRWLRSVVLVLSLSFLAACAAETVATTPLPPPPPVPEVAPDQPGTTYVWVPGQWAWRSRVNAYVWVPGRWDTPESPGSVWVPGRWDLRGGSYAWVEGHWVAR